MCFYFSLLIEMWQTEPIYDNRCKHITAGFVRSKDNSCSFELFKLAGLKNKKYYDLIQGIWNTTQPNRIHDRHPIRMQGIIRV